MAKNRSRLGFVLRPNPEEKAVSLMTRARFAMLGANGLQPISQSNSPALYGMLEQVSEHAGMPAPRAYIWTSKKPMANAVAMPAKVPTIAFSQSITEILNPEELAAVAGHELGHVKNLASSGRLYWLSAIGGGTLAHFAAKPFKKRLREDMAAGRGTILHVAADSAISLGQLVAPVAAGALATRSEELAADRHGAYTMAGNAVPLISALDKLSNHNRQQARRPVDKISQVILKPVLDATRTHPTYNQRRQALGVTQEAVAAYQEKTKTPPTTAQEPKKWGERVEEAGVVEKQAIQTGR